MTSSKANISETFVRKLEGFGPLPEADKAALRGVAVDGRRVDAHQDLIREGDAPDGVFLILDGIAGRYKMHANGGRQIMAYLLPGDFCDSDVAFLSRMDHSIGTLSACRVVCMPTETIRELQQRPALSRALRIAALVNAANAREWLVNAGQRSAPERIAHLFCELMLRLETVGLATWDGYDFPLTQTDLADTTGLSVVHVNRSLQALRGDGLLKWHSGRLTFLDLPRLREFAGFRPNYLHLSDRAAA